MQCVRLICNADPSLKSICKNYEQLKRAFKDCEFSKDYTDQASEVFQYCLSNIQSIPKDQVDACYYLLSNWTPALEEQIIGFVTETFKQQQIVEREIPVYPTQQELLGTHGYIFLRFLLFIISVVEDAESKLPKATCSWTVHNSRLWG